MAISIQCPGCSKGYRVPDEAAGRSTKCKACGHTLVIPMPSAAAAFSATPAAPAPAPVSFEHPPLAAPRRTSKRNRLFLAVAASVVVCLFAVSSYVVATWFLGGSGLGGSARYLPEGVDAVAVINVEEFLDGSLYAELKKISPDQEKQLDNAQVPMTKVRRIVAGGTSDSKKAVTIFETKSNIEIDVLKKALKRKPDQFKEEMVGDYTVYRYANPIRMTFRAVGDRIGAAPSEPKVEYTEAFCVPETNVIVYAKFDVLKEVLERGAAPELSAELKDAMSDVDFSSTVAFAATIRELPPEKKNGFNPFKQVTDQIKGIDRITGEIDAASDLNVRITVRCKETKKAKELRDLAAGGIAMIKTMGGDKIPADVMKVLDAVSIEANGNVLTGTMKVDQALLVGAAKAAKDSTGSQTR